MTALDLTRAGLLRALGDLMAHPAIDRAVHQRAETLVAEVEEDATNTTVAKRGPGDYVVTVSAPGLFAREFGSLGREAEPLIGTAIDRMARRREP
jgi:hypothetical protein